MKKTIIIILVALFLTGCRKSEYKEPDNSIDIQFSEDVCNPLAGVDCAYYYKCPDGGLFFEETYDIEYFINYNGVVKVADANYGIKDYDELLSYFEAYVCNLFEFEELRENGSCDVALCDYIYIKRYYNNECYLLPVLRLKIRRYGEVYIEVNSGCIIW